MLQLQTYPANREHFEALWAFCEDVLAICARLGVDPVMNASLAVLLYSNCADLEVHDVDLSCPEADFPAIVETCRGAGIDAEVMEWNVLELHLGELKVEFDGAEHWMQGLIGDTEVFVHGAGTVRVVCREDLATLYRRGVDAFEGKQSPAARERLADLQHKLSLLGAAT